MTRRRPPSNERMLRRRVLAELQAGPLALRELEARVADVATPFQLRRVTIQLLKGQEIVSRGARRAPIYCLWADAVADLRVLPAPGPLRELHDPPFVRGELVA